MVKTVKRKNYEKKEIGMPSASNVSVSFTAGSNVQ